MTEISPALDPATGHVTYPGAMGDAELAARLAYECPAAAVKAEPSAPPASIAELHRERVRAYIAMIHAHNRLTAAEAAHNAAVKASALAGRS